MECIPAIDLRGGQAVRLHQGDFSRETGYGDPVALASRYAAAGARRLHVVDLDAARGASGSNRAVVEAIVDAVGVEIQLGGGIRSEEIVEVYLSRGVGRVVLGTAGIEDRALLARLCAAYPGRILLGLDHRRSVAPDGTPHDELALRGWTEGSGRELRAVLAEVAAIGLAGVIVTDISRDGTMAGPDLAGLASLLEETPLALIASGGVARLEHLAALAALRGGGRALAGVIVGRALMSGAFSVEEAIAACAP